MSILIYRGHLTYRKRDDAPQSVVSRVTEVVPPDPGDPPQAGHQAVVRPLSGCLDGTESDPVAPKHCVHDSSPVGWDPRSARATRGGGQVNIASAGGRGNVIRVTLPNAP